MSELESLVNAAEGLYIDGLAEGPQREAVGRSGVGVGDIAPDVELVDHKGDTVSLSSYWIDAPALFIFWRHFGCGCGADRAERLAVERGTLAEAGARVVLIGMGDPVRTSDYRNRFEITEPFLCDPERRAYDAFGVPEGTLLAAVYDDEDMLLGGADTWRMVVDFKRSKSMHLVDNGWQLMSEFVVGTDGLIRMAYRYQYCDNFPDPRLAVSAVKEANAGLDPFRGSAVAPEA